MPAKRRRGRPPDERAAYRQLADRLAADLRGRWPLGKPLPARRRLARTYDVSEKTMRRALAYLASENRLAVTPAGTYRALGHGSVASLHANAVVLILGHNLALQWSHDAYRGLQEGIEREMGKLWDPLIIVHEPAKFLRRGPPPDLLDRPVRGILLLGPFTRDALRAYARIGLPTVLVDRPSPVPGLASVCVDNERAARDAIRRLHALGHRRIAFVRRIHLTLSEIDDDSKEREAGFRKEAKVLHLPGRTAIYNFLDQRGPKNESLRAIFRETPPYTALLAVDGESAQWAIDSAAEAGLAVPRDLSVAAFLPESGPRTISGPRIDFVVMGKAAVQGLAAVQKGLPLPRLATRWEPGRTIASRTEP